MPIYEYECGSCGGFTALRPINERDAPQSCPTCDGTSARRISMPAVFPGLSAALRQAHTVDERAAHEPRRIVTSEMRATHDRGVGSASSGGESIARSSHGRPWMIGH